ncbi:MAG: HNH endonuclease signature motif containing protein [Dermatophilaceae bacterium]
MDREGLTSRITALREQCAALGRELVEHGRALDSADAFAVAGALQGVVNTAEGAQAMALAWGARVEERPAPGGVVQRVHPAGYVSEMAVSLACLETGVTEGLAGRKVRLGADLVARFPTVLGLLVGGDLSASAAHKVLDACEGLDADACRAVDEALAPRLAGLDPAAVTRTTRSVAARVATEQVAARAEATKRSRCVEVSPAGPDGLTTWWALLPTATAAAAYAAVDRVATDYRAVDPALSVPESRADAFADLLLRNVTVTAQVTLGVPVLTGQPAAPAVDPHCAGADMPSSSRVRVDWAEEDIVHVDHTTGEVLTFGQLDPAGREAASWMQAPAVEHPCGGAADSASVDDRYWSCAPVDDGCAVSGAEIPGVGWVDATTVAALLKTLPVHLARALLDADTGTLVATTTTAYAPTVGIRDFVQTRDGTCRMWGCNRRASHADLDHTRPWPDGHTSPRGLAALCRRHHRMKQLGRWRYTLHDDGDITWADPTGRVRRTHPAHRVIPRPAPTSGRASGASPRRGPGPVHAETVQVDQPPPF